MIVGTECGSESDEESSEASEKTSSDSGKSSSESEESSSESDSEQNKKNKTKKVAQKRSKPAAVNRYAQIPSSLFQCESIIFLPRLFGGPDVSCFFLFFLTLARPNETGGCL